MPDCALVPDPGGRISLWSFVKEVDDRKVILGGNPIWFTFCFVTRYQSQCFSRYHNVSLDNLKTPFLFLFFKTLSVPVLLEK